MDDGQAKTQSLGVGVGLLGHARVASYNHRISIVGNLEALSHLVSIFAKIADYPRSLEYIGAERATPSDCPRVCQRSPGFLSGADP